MCTGALSHMTDTQHNQLTGYYLLPAAGTILHPYASPLRFVLSDLPSAKSRLPAAGTILHPYASPLRFVLSDLPSAKSRLPDADTVLHSYASSLLIFLRYMLLIVPDGAGIHKEHLIQASR